MKLGKSLLTRSDLIELVVMKRLDDTAMIGVTETEDNKI